MTGYYVSCDPALVDVALVHEYLSERSYWAKGLELETVRRSIEHSLCFGVYREHEGAQVGFARVVTDRATFAYLADVFVLEPHRGRGLSIRLMEAIVAHPELQGLRRWMLFTADAQGLYGKFGFRAPQRPERLMERYSQH
jgi:GNAT superfamily N-acetyltransferase